MNDRKKDLIIFLLITVISLFGTFVGKIIAIYFEIKPIYGIVIGFFIPIGIKSILSENMYFGEDMIYYIGMFILMLLVPTLGLSIIFVSFIGISIIIIMATIKGIKEMTMLLLSFISAQSKKEFSTYFENQNKDKETIIENGEKI